MSDSGINVEFPHVQAPFVGQMRNPETPKQMEAGSDYPASRLPSAKRALHPAAVKDRKRRPWLMMIGYDAIALLAASFTLVLFGALARVVKFEQGGDALGPALVSGIGVWLALTVVRHINSEVNSALTLTRWWMPDWRLRFGGWLWGVIAAVIFLAAIFGGAILASWATWAIQQNNDNTHAGAPAIGGSLTAAFFVEALGTFFWAWSFLATGCWSTDAEGWHLHSGPIVQGFVHTAIVYLALPYSGGSFNPLGWLALAWVGEYFQVGYWIFIVAPVVGALLATFAWTFVFGDIAKAPKKARKGDDEEEKKE